jgi:predicted metal-binding protein
MVFNATFKNISVKCVALRSIVLVGETTVHISPKEAFSDDFILTLTVVELNGTCHLCIKCSLSQSIVHIC